MAIYHLEAKVVSRGGGRSAVAASAYLSCSKILNVYDGVQHDYTRKKGLVWEQIFLPEYAPHEWQDRSALWNAVEENEKTKDSRLAREFVPALPIELTPAQWQELLSDFIQTSFVIEGMCADVAIHDPDPPGHNPHAHIMVTVRPLDEQGKWQYKTEKEYLCVKNGEEKGFTAAEFKAAQADGWEKQYPYKVGRKKVYMPPSEAEKHGYERASKHPKSTKFGRQNPITERWNSEEQLVRWRKEWADVTNRYLEKYGHDARIDYRSHADRGLSEQPTIHEGVVARALEKKGVISDRCEINRQIKADNALLRELKATVKKLMQAVKNTVPAIAEAMEKLRGNMLIFSYQLRHIGAGKYNIGKRINTVKPELELYAGLVRQIKEKSKERKSLLAEKKETPLYQPKKLYDLTRRIAELTEELEELKSEKAMLLNSLDCAEDADISTVLYCADCGEKLYFCTTNSFSPKQEHYVCSNYKSNTGTCSAHFIREETLKLFVRQRIFDVTAMFFDDIQGFQNMVYQQRFEEAEKAVKQKKKELEQARKRIAELDRIFKRIYEDDISGTISHERFLKLSAEYEAEQRELTEFVHTEQTAVDTYEQDRTDFDSFAAVIRKYVGIRELTPTIVNEFVKKIIVHAPDKSTGHRRQRIEIVWNFIGELEQDEDKQIIERRRKSETA